MSDPRDVWVKLHKCDELLEARFGFRPAKIYRYENDDPRASLGWLISLEGDPHSICIEFCPYCGKKLEAKPSPVKA